MGSRSMWMVLIVVAAAVGASEGLVDIDRGQLIKSTASSKQLLGSLVEVSGDTLAAAAVASDGFRGAVFIYKKVNGRWERKQRLQPSELSPGDQFGWALDYTDNYLAVGAVGRKINGKKQGKAYIFERSGPRANFRFKQSFIGDDNQNGDNYAYSITLEGNNIFVTAEQGLVPSGSANGEGKVYHYQRSAGTWRKKQVLRGDKFGDQFGDETSWSSGTLAVGAPFGDNGLNGIADTGTAYVYKVESGKLKRKAKLMAADSTKNNNFGTTLVISKNGKTIVVGSDRANGEVSNVQGAAYVFKENSSGSWKLVQKIIAMDGHYKGWFGHELWITDQFLAVGSYKKDDGNIKEAGAVYIFKKNNFGRYKESQVLRLPKRHTRDTFGVGVSISGKTMVVGCPRYDTNRSSSSTSDTGLDNGAVQIFNIKVDPDNAINFLPRVIEIPVSGSFNIGVEYATKVRGVIRGRITDGSTVKSQGEISVSAGSGITKVKLTSRGLQAGKSYTLTIVLRRAGRAVKKRSIQDVKAVRT